MSRFANLEFGREHEGDLESREIVKDGPYYFSEARTAFEQGRFADALRHYAKVLEFTPDHAPAWTGQVRALIELGEFREAQLWAEKALERFPRDAELLAAKAVALDRSGKLDEALAFSDAAMEERGDTPYTWLARGDVLLARSESRADYCFDKALALAPKDWFIAWLAARVRYFYQQFTQALALAQRALEWQPSQSMLWLMAGLCQQQLGFIGSARASLTQARQLNPACREADLALVGLSNIGLGARVSGWLRYWFR
jgi:tetratricopeptide (TPR) repeat protein